jgi:ankyrin repeat/BTB/POZ domain-containing protein 1
MVHSVIETHFKGKSFILYIKAWHLILAFSERCLYGALNSDIKNLLLSYKITKAIDENQPYLLFLANTFEDHPHSDLTFTIQVPHNDGSEYYAHQFQAHRFVLAARSHYFHENLVDRWRDHHEIKLQRSLVLPGSFLAILRYIYTGHLGGLDPDVLENMAFASKHLELTDLQTRCEEELETILHGTERDAHKSHSKKEIDKVRSDFEQFYKQLSGTFIYADKGDQGKAWKMRCPFPQDAAPSDPTSVFADIVIQMQDVLFPVHKVCLCRSEFFNMMLSNLFHESELDNTAIEYADTTLLLQVVELHSIQPETFRYVVEFLYTDRCTIPAQEAFDVMLAADMLLLDKLKSIAAIALTSQLEPVVDIYQLFRTAVQLNVDRVEQYCIKYMAEHLDDFIEEEAFLDIVRESAETIKMRQETGIYHK